jgi:uncharacterized protein (TIGR00251 family)
MRYTLFVKPGSKKGPLVEVSEDGTVTVFVRERAIDGAANKAVIELLAKHFGVAKSAVEIESGFTSKHKRVRIG